ncbi:MAG: DUF2442 domain-containing protein [Oscillospiraceae bacterium]
MYVIDGIAYAGEQPKPVRVKAVRPLESYKVFITFTDGQQKIFDFSPLLSMSCYEPLKNKEVFDRVYVEYGTLVWNDGEIDIAPETLLADGVSVTESA